MHNRIVLAFGLMLTMAAPAAAQDTLDPKRGSEIGTVVEAFLSPHQEPGEEKDTPSLVPSAFRSTAPSKLRADRTSRGHGRVRFTRDMSRAYVELAVENVNPDDVMMLHIHCGKPDILGPIIADFSHLGDLKKFRTNDLYKFEVTNSLIEATVAGGHGVIGLITAGCPIYPSNPVLGKVKTVAGMEYIARLGELYFNVHTKGQMFYGDIRGQLIPVAK